MQVRKWIAGALTVAALVVGPAGAAQAHEGEAKRAKVEQHARHACAKAERMIAAFGRAQAEMERLLARFEETELRARDAGREKLADRLHRKVERLQARLERTEELTARLRVTVDERCGTAPAPVEQPAG
jgi:molecular chaperone GrpE (heat shock protein)